MTGELGRSERLEAVFAMGAFAAAKAEDAAELLTFLESGRAGALLDTLGSREALRWKAETLSPELQLADTRAEAARRRAREANSRNRPRGYFIAGTGK